MLEIEEPDAALCIGTELTLTAHLRTPAIPNYNYTWGGDTPLEPGEVTNTEDTFTTVNTTIPASPGTYRFYVSMQNQSGDCKASDTVTVIAKDFSTLPITTDEWVCPEEVVTLSGITSAATAEQIYRWYDSDWNLIKTDTLPAGTPSTYITEPVTSPATYYLSAYDANSCAWDPLFMPLIEYQPLHTPVAATDTLNFTSDKNGLTTTLDATDRIAFFDEGGINGNISTSIPAENAWTHTFKTSEGQVEIHFHTFQVFDMNGNYGTIRVFDGMSATGVPLLTMDAPQSNIVVKSTSGSLTVQWYKKHSGSGESGWNADITVSSPIYHASEAHVGLKDPSECLLSSLIVQSNDCTLLYNAQEQTCEYYTVTYGDVTVPECTSCPAVPGTHYYILPTGDTVTVFDPISVRDVTDTVNGFEVIIQNSGNYSDIDTIYGNVKVTPIPLIITTDSDSKEYDGTPLTDDGWLDTPPVGLAPGDTVIFVDNHGTITEPGESFNYATTAIVVNTISGDTVTGNYDINYVFGTLTIYPPMNVLPINELVHVSCHGANDGRWTLVVSGGKPGVRTYTLDGGASVTLSDDTIRLTNLTPGNHQLVVTNVLGTTITIDFIVNEPDPLGVAVVVPINVADRCPNQGAYEVSAFVTGGTQPYSFEWSGDASSVNNNTTIVNQLGANDCNVEYMAVVLVNDFNFCEARDTARFTVLDTVKPTFTVPDSIAICRTQPSGSFDASPSVTGFPSSLNDNCTPAAQLFVTFRDEDTTGTEPGARLIMRKWTVKDACGNSITKTQKILIKPQTTHATITFTCPPDTNVILAYGACDTLLGIGNPSFTTDFSDMDYTITHDAPVDSIYSTGTTVVTWTLTDECGFSTHCQQNVEVVYPPCGTPADSVWDWNNIAYSSVRIGCQCWTGENLRSEHYSDGTPIPNHTRYMDNDSLEMVYGKLYSWYSAARVGEGDDSSVPADSMSFFGPYVQGICPAGWALPTVAEYWEMYNASGGHAGLVKSPSTLVWLPGREGTAPNLFEAFGAGYYDDSIQRYQNLLGETRFWAADYTTGSSMAKVFTLNYYCEDGQIVESRKGLGYSIRCIRKK
ncbi:MAG: fibrobacter succinogenes major paralogous domain-containing protein [Bacteroidales bacterium]|nr:fibrobacter succinogenes major paralogous domain-containing protein [Bacteroidales bacterium]